jgi:mono/diheme cytochrome c family protein
VNSRIRFGVVVLAVGWIAGCEPTPMEYVLSDYSQQELREDAQAQETLRAALVETFGTPETPLLPDAIKSAVDAKIIRSNADGLATGAKLYRHWCMHCHGLSGDGNGPTAPFLTPKPRDYRNGVFKFTSTAGLPNRMKPTRDDLMYTLLNGAPGTSMPSFRIFYDESNYEGNLDAVLDYVILLSMRGETERAAVGTSTAFGDPISTEMVLEEAEGVAKSWVAANEKVVSPTKPKPAADPESIARGRQLYLTKGECAKCHGPLARGDGWDLDPNPDPTKNKDDWGSPAKPLDLTLGVYHGGGRPIDLFRRIHDGVKGTPMAAQSVNLKEEEIWDLVNYVRSIPYDGPGAAAPAAATPSH